MNFTQPIQDQPAQWTTRPGTYQFEIVGAMDSKKSPDPSQRDGTRFLDVRIKVVEPVRDYNETEDDFQGRYDQVDTTTRIRFWVSAKTLQYAVPNMMIFAGLDRSQEAAFDEEDDLMVKSTLGHVASAVNEAERTHPQLAFVDIQLAQGDSGLDAAAELQKRGVICIFLTGNPPGGPRPDLALGCLPKPFSDVGLAGAVKLAEAVINGLPLPQPPFGLELYRL